MEKPVKNHILHRLNRSPPLSGRGNALEQGNLSVSNVYCSLLLLYSVLVIYVLLSTIIS